MTNTAAEVAEVVTTTATKVETMTAATEAAVTESAEVERTQVHPAKSNTLKRKPKLRKTVLEEKTAANVTTITKKKRPKKGRISPSPNPKTKLLAGRFQNKT